MQYYNVTCTLFVRCFLSLIRSTLACIFDKSSVLFGLLTTCCNTSCRPILNCAILHAINYFELMRKRWRFGSVGNVIGCINEVNQRRARLVLGWATVCRRINHLGIVASHPGQLSLAIPPWVGAMSTSESWDVNRHTGTAGRSAGRCRGMHYTLVSVVWQCKLVSG